MKALRAVLMAGLVCIFVFSIPFPGECQDDPFAQTDALDSSLDEEMEWLQAETYVITASKVLENIKKSAASITVITDRDIRRMGAQNFLELLRMLPGISCYPERHAGYDTDVRGIMKDGDQHILYLLNGHSLNMNYWGGVDPTYSPTVLENIKRIEIIRGPGSALYGANAFAAVINIITKTAEDFEGAELSVRGGSYDTQQYNLLVGKTVADVGFSLNFNYYKTHGFRGYIEQDAQTLLDQQFGTNISLAPGYTRADHEKYDLTLILEYEGFRLEGKYANRERTPTIGISPVLNNHSQTPTDSYMVTAGYETTLENGLSLSSRAYYNYMHMDYYYQIYPEGVVLPTPDGLAVWPDGLIGAPSNKNTRSGIEFQSTYPLNDAHTIVAGLTFEQMEQYDVKARSNYLATPVKDVVIQLDSVQDTTMQNYNKNVSRTFKAVFLEDIWDLRDDVRLTVGARYDDYSDFGDSFNPRAGLVWNLAEHYNLKLLYGRAFRAPSFYELYNKNNPAFVGNPDLKPETVDTYEISLGAQLTTALEARITGFRNDVKESIDLATYDAQDVFENRNEIRAQGVEVELKYDFGKGTYLAMNYTYEDSTNAETEDRLYNIPEHKGNVMANVRFSRQFNLFTTLHFEDGFTREEGDPREDENPGFAVVDATLLVKEFLPRLDALELRASVYNLSDHEYTVPTAKDGLPVDYPMPGRNFLIEARYTF